MRRAISTLAGTESGLATVWCSRWGIMPVFTYREHTFIEVSRGPWGTLRANALSSFSLGG